MQKNKLHTERYATSYDGSRDIKVAAVAVDGARKVAPGPQLDAQMRVARKIMTKRQDLLRKLAD